MRAQHDHDNLGGSNRLLPLVTAAELLGVPPERLRKRWKAWGITSYKVGRELRFRERDLAAWVAKRVTLMRDLQVRRRCCGAVAGDSCRRRRAGRARTAVAAWAWCALGGGAGYVLQDRTAAAAGLAVAVVIVACAAVILGAVLLGDEERRSPFVRFMLLVCVLTGRPPSEYLPPESGER